jgi:hypothetical protein
MLIMTSPAAQVEIQAEIPGGSIISRFLEREDERCMTVFWEQDVD